MVETNGNQEQAAEQLPKEHAIIKLSRQSLVNHFVTRNMDVALAHMTDDVEWLGPFACQTASSKKAMQDILRPEYGIRLALADERWRARKRAGTWIVSACYTLLVVSADGERSIPFEQRATYVWAPTPDGPRIVHLHVSNTTEFLYEHFDDQGSGTGKISFRDIGGDLHVLHPNELHAVESEGPRCVVKHAHGEFTVRAALADIEEELPARDFLRLHRSCLVHRGRIVSIEGYRAKLDDGSEYPIAERRYRSVKQALVAPRSVLESTVPPRLSSPVDSGTRP